MEVCFIISRSGTSWILATNIYFDFIIFYICFSLLDIYPRGGGITVSFTIFFYRTCKGFPLKNRQKVAASVVVVVALLILQDSSRAGFYFIHFSGINKFISLHAPTYSRKPKKLSLLISIVYQWYITIKFESRNPLTRKQGP